MCYVLNQRTLVWKPPFENLIKGLIIIIIDNDIFHVFLLIAQSKQIVYTCYGSINLKTNNLMTHP